MEEEEKAGAIVCRRAREEFLSITVCGGARVFIWGSRVGRVSGRTAARSQVAGSIN